MKIPKLKKGVRHRSAVKACMAIVNDLFAEHGKKLKHRSTEEQVILGSWLIVLEGEMEKDLKKLL